MESYSWAGNIRELKNEIQRLAILCDEIIYPEDLSFNNNKTDTEVDISNNNSEEAINGNFSLENHLVEIEKSFYRSAMKQTGNNKTQAAKLLNVSYRTFNYQWEKYK